MKKTDVINTIRKELDFLYNQMVNETSNKKNYLIGHDPGYSRVCEYNAIVRLAFMLDLIDGSKMDKMTNNILDTYIELRDKVLKE